ncbi:sigma-70 family RNA polymerase sigma factor [Alkalicoccus chagannorensis]|uniref:sigma-70 family RNA polymerase sigma factor n=1 Tax=Alkalicoccus chagannorensis TaxID=427072 RepID=UPI00041A9116|nr:sigma-70 family RNA polymerase sigma factor [Alkalicoccus chagannorensis]
MTFEEVEAQFMPMVYGALRRWKLQGEAEEFEQTGRIALYEAWQKFDGDKGAFAPFAQSYVNGRIRQQLTRQNRERERFACTPPEIMELHDAPAPGRESQLELRDVIARMPLSERQRCWLIGYVLDNLTVREIAEREDVSIETVKSWRKEAKKKLAAWEYIDEVRQK